MGVVDVVGTEIDETEEADLETLDENNTKD